MTDITQILHRLGSGEEQALAELTPLVYSNLRKIAQKQLGENDASCWDATELVHEAYLRMIGDAPIAWKDRTHFFAVAASVIRRILVDHARHRNRQKRGGGLEQARVEIQELSRNERTPELTALDEALNRLSELNDRHAKLIELRFFGGLTLTEAAEYLGVSRRTAAGDWAMARAWLYRELQD